MPRVGSRETRARPPGRLKKLYKRRALELHPDKSSHPDAAGRFRRLQEAYEALKDPSARSYFQRFARYGGSLWQNVKTYADDRLTVERRGWVRSARGMRMSTERVRLNDDFVNMREPALEPTTGEPRISPEMARTSRGAAPAATWIFRDESRRRRGHHVDNS